MESKSRETVLLLSMLWWGADSPCLDAACLGYLHMADKFESKLATLSMHHLYAQKLTCFAAL